MAVPLPTQISVQIRKSMPYRGNTVVWSNRWFFDKTALPSDSDKDAIVTTIFNQEQIQYSPRVTFLDGIWRAVGSEVPVHTSPLSGSGSMVVTSMSPCPGDCAAVLRFSTTQRTSKNHPIYLFKYFHDVYYVTGANVDTMDNVQEGRILALGNMFVSGITQGGITYKGAGPRGAVAQGASVSPLISHRDFPR